MPDSQNATPDVSTTITDAFTTYHVRIAGGLGNLPYPVNLVLPDASRSGLTAQEHRTPGHFYIDDVVPKTDDHHIILARFIDEWGHLEMVLHFLFHKLAKIDLNTAEIILSTMGIKQIIDSITSLATNSLSDDGIDLVVTMMERVSKLNSKRNILVHGNWCLELFIWHLKSEVKMRSHLLREVSPPDLRIAKTIFDVRNQKNRVKYTFTLKRIIAATKDCRILLKDLSTLNVTLDNYPAPKN